MLVSVETLSDQAVVCVACGCPPLAGNKFCQSCGKETHPVADICIKCGVVLKSGVRSATGNSDCVVASNPPKDPVLMGVLSCCCIVGLGQIILGQVVKGIVILIVSIVLGVLTGGFSVLVTFPAVGIDAYLIAQKLKEGKTVGQWEFF